MFHSSFKIILNIEKQIALCLYAHHSHTLQATYTVQQNFKQAPFMQHINVNCCLDFRWCASERRRTSRNTKRHKWCKYTSFPKHLLHPRSFICLSRSVSTFLCRFPIVSFPFPCLDFRWCVSGRRRTSRLSNWHKWRKYRSFAQHFPHPRSLIGPAKNSNCSCALLAFFSILFQFFFFFQISDDVLIEADNLREGKATGYIHIVSPLQNNHFDFQLHTKNKTIRAACFDKSKRNYLKHSCKFRLETKSNFGDLLMGQQKFTDLLR